VIWKKHQYNTIQNYLTALQNLSSKMLEKPWDSHDYEFNHRDGGDRGPSNDETDGTAPLTTYGIIFVILLILSCGCCVGVGCCLFCRIQKIRNQEAAQNPRPTQPYEEDSVIMEASQDFT